MRPITLTDVNVISNDGEEVLNGGKSCILSSSDEPLLYYTNIETLNNKKIKHNESYSIKCKTGYNTTDGKEFIYKCNDGELIFDTDNSTVDSDCRTGCNDISPVYDINNNKVSNQLYGITYAGTGDRDPSTVLVACVGDNISSVVNLNASGTGLGIVAPDNYIKYAKNTGNSITNYHTEPGRKLICKQNSNVNNNEPYWQYQYNSCDLNELKKYSGLNIQLKHIASLKNIDDIMTTGAKQVRFFSYNRGNITDLSWSRPYATLNKVEGNLISGSASVICNVDGTWSVSSSGYIEYIYTNNSQTFTPTNYNAQGKNLKLEVWGAQGGESKTSGKVGGLGGYSYGNYTAGSDNLYIYVGQQGINTSATEAFNGGGYSDYTNGGGGGGATHISTYDDLLKNLNNNKSSILIVAGGGGGASYNNNGGNGGGGGNNGENGTNISCSGLHIYGGGGTQSESSCYKNQSFCLGGFGYGNSRIDAGNGGGGGGYYGGGGGNGCNGGKDAGSGGGGSGYIGGVSNGNGENGNNSGNGKAKISW